MNWYIVCTKPRWEKKVSEQLNQLGLKCYCPMIKKKKESTNKKAIIEIPLFSTHIFIQTAEKNRKLAFHSSGVVKYLFWLGKHAIVKDEEINTIKEWLEGGNSLQEITVLQYQNGDKKHLNSGIFFDEHNLVSDITKTHYVLIVESLGFVLKLKNTP
jgi:transcription antitermination factor NusG